MSNHLVDNFCNSFNPIDYLKLQSNFTCLELPISSISIAENPAIDVLSNDLLSSQQCSRGSRCYYYSSGDNGPPIVVDSISSYSITPLLSDFISSKYTTTSRSCESRISTTKVLGHGPVHWRFIDSNNTSQDLYLQVQHIPDAGICLFSHQQNFVAYQGRFCSLTRTFVILLFQMEFLWYSLQSP